MKLKLHISMTDGSAEEHEIEADGQSDSALLTVRGYATYCMPAHRTWLTSEIKEITIKPVTE